MKPTDIPDGPHVLKPGEYGKWAHDGNWYLCCPSHNDLLANLARHTITEHDDSTITVSPSILCEGGPASAGISWHGYLERGVCREC